MPSNCQSEQSNKSVHNMAHSTTKHGDPNAPTNFGFRKSRCHPALPSARAIGPSDGRRYHSRPLGTQRRITTGRSFRRCVDFCPLMKCRPRCSSCAYVCEVFHAQEILCGPTDRRRSALPLDAATTLSLERESQDPARRARGLPSIPAKPMKSLPGLRNEGSSQMGTPKSQSISSRAGSTSSYGSPDVSPPR